MSRHRDRFGGHAPSGIEILQETPSSLNDAWDRPLALPPAARWPSLRPELELPELTRDPARVDPPEQQRMPVVVVVPQDRIGDRHESRTIH